MKRTTFSYSRRRSYLRCEYVCGGFTGLHPDGQWSTWSPGRFSIPEKDEAFLPAIIQGVKAYGQRPEMEGGYHHSLMPGTKLWLTCGHCQLICHPDKAVRKERYDMLKQATGYVGIFPQSHGIEASLCITRILDPWNPRILHLDQLFWR